MFKKILENKDDIKILVDEFYSKIKKDESLGFIFNDVMQVNWEKHLPKMYSFWEFILFHTGGYDGTPFPHHIKVNEHVKLTAAHFDTWIDLFNATVDEYFEGENADTIKKKANNIKLVWSYKLTNLSKEEN